MVVRGQEARDSVRRRRIDFPTYMPLVSRASDYDGTRVGYTREEPDQHSGTYTSRQIESTEAWSQGGCCVGERQPLRGISEAWA
jgi:hypothetical protein